MACCEQRESHRHNSNPAQPSAVDMTANKRHKVCKECEYYNCRGMIAWCKITRRGLFAMFRDGKAICPHPQGDKWHGLEVT